MNAREKILENKAIRFTLFSCRVSGEEIDRIEISVAYDDFRQLLLLCQGEQNTIFSYFTINYTTAEVSNWSRGTLKSGRYWARRWIYKFNLSGDTIPFGQSKFIPDEHRANVYLANDVDMINAEALIGGLFMHTLSSKKKAGSGLPSTFCGHKSFLKHAPADGQPDARAFQSPPPGSLCGKP